MRKEEFKQLDVITDISNHAVNNGIIEFGVNGEIVFLSIVDDTVMNVDNIKSIDTSEIIQAYILKFGDNTYYPNFKNGYEEMDGKIQLVSKEKYFWLLENLIELNKLYYGLELVEVENILDKLKACHFSIYDFYKFQKILQVATFINYFHKDGVPEKTMAIASIETANKYSKADDDKDLFDMQYIMHCARHKNFKHLPDYLRKEIKKLLKNITKELSN